MSDGVNFTFNKGQNFDISKFDGVSKEELIKKAGGKNSQQGKLIETIFAKYDNGDGILTAAEYSKLQADLITFAKDDNLSNKELKRFNKENLGIDKKAYSMEDMQAVIGMMVDGTDDITNVTEYADGLKVTHKPKDGVGTKTETYQAGENGGLTLLEDEVVNGDMTTITRYADGEKKGSKLEIVKNDWQTLTVYGDDGETPSLITRTKGIETYEMDPKNPDRPLSYEKNGQPQKTTVLYSYNGDEVTETTYLGDDKTKPTKVEVKGGANPHVTEYSYDGDVTTETTTVEGQEPVVVKKDKDGNVIPETTTYDVKSGEVWYNIVAAKYGVSDHKVIMDIVHQLKDAAGIERNSTKMPSNITLPNEIKSGDKTYKLNIDASTNPELVKKSVPVQSNPVAEETEVTKVPVQEQQDNTEDVDPCPPHKDNNPPKKLSKPLTPPSLMPLKFAAPSVVQLFSQKADALMANKTITNSDGTKTVYDSEGKVKEICYADGKTKYCLEYPGIINEKEYDMNGNEARVIVRNMDGELYWVYDYEYDINGNESSVTRDANGKVTESGQYLYDAKGNEYRRIARDGDGNVTSYTDFERDKDGKLERAVYRKPNGEVDCYENANEDLARKPDGTVYE